MGEERAETGWNAGWSFEPLDNSGVASSQRIMGPASYRGRGRLPKRATPRGEFVLIGLAGRQMQQVGMPWPESTPAEQPGGARRGKAAKMQPRERLSV